jgi:eukaryotic-like serine/threonine-protein kinase
VNRVLGVTAAQSLEGLTLATGWTIGSLIERSPDATGGLASEQYLVTHADGSRAFLKALDYSFALNKPNTPVLLNAMTQAFLHEERLLKECARARMTHVVRALDSGSVEVPEFGRLSKVDYLIFEWADTDIRQARDARDPVDQAWGLRVLHNVAVGLWQLHREGISHQDLKPSNVLVFDERLSKIADLGRAAQLNFSGPHDDLRIPGTIAYAPPELLYGHHEPSVQLRRRSADVFHLGSLCMFMYTGIGATAWLAKELPEGLLWENFVGDYPTVLPYVREAFDRAVRKMARVVPADIRNDISTAVRELCDPDPNHRGDAWMRARAGNPYSLERYISKFDLLARRAELQFRLPASV